MRAATRLLFIVAIGLVGLGAHAASAPSYDIVIRDGRVIDGTGSPWYSADIAIKDGRIAAIGRLGRAIRTRASTPRSRGSSPNTCARIMR